MIINGLYKKSGGGGQTPATGFVPSSWDSDGKITAGTWYGSGRIPDYYFAVNNGSSGSCFTTLSDLIFDGSPNAVGQGAFFNCGSLALTSLPEQVTWIGGNAFQNCAALALTHLPPNLNTLGANAFNTCRNLALASLPDRLTVIRSYCFQSCGNITLTSLPAGITSIETNAFKWCEKLALTSLPAGLSGVLNNGAFYGCQLITIKTIPVGVNQIAPMCFQGCSSLTSITASGLDQTNSNSNSLVFSECTNLATADLQHPGKLAANYFRQTALSTLIIRQTDEVCVADASAFQSTPLANGQGVVYVPSALVSAYEAAATWSTLKAAGTTFLPIEGSIYETQYADGTPV